MVQISHGQLGVDRMDAHLDEVRDPVLLIIKGHLLVEEALRLALAVNGEDVRRVENLTAHGVIRRAKELMGNRGNFCLDSDKERIWDALFALNTLRNQVAHNLEPSDCNRLLARIFLVQPDEPTSILDPDMILPIHGALAFLISFAQLIRFEAN